MCGIAGFWTQRGSSADLTSVVRRMTDAIRHRGPDDEGNWIDREAGLVLGHRRLSIIDLSPLGHQPMVSNSERYIIIYNGEVYNFTELAAELRARGVSFRGHSDTEIMLAAIEAWGLVGAVERFVGMFAFALWDRQERRLHLVRDRLGEKPLYYGVQKSTLLFGSELKALRAHPDWVGEVDRNTLTLFLRHNYIPAPHSIHVGIRKVVPGTIVSLDGPQSEPKIHAYWDARRAAEYGTRNPLTGSDDEVTDDLEKHLRRTIRREMIADVPLGAFLSGGIDSSTIVALMQAESSRPVKTFTIGFREAEFNEAAHARAVATHLGTDHTEHFVTAAETLAVVPRLPSLYDEPFADSSQVPTFLVAQMARREVTVSLSGDGGDELLGGYNRYFLGRRLWSAIGPIPARARRWMVRGMRAVPVARWNALYRRAAIALPREYQLAVPGDKIHKLAGILGTESPEAMYRELVTQWREPASLVAGAHEPATILTQTADWPDLPSFTHRMMYLDLVSYLPDDILVKVDRASMGVSLETRAPFLDHELVEFAWRVPLELKMRNGGGKWLLRNLLHRHVPKALVERPKMGFGIPIDSWLRGPLREWAAALIDPDRLRREGYLAPEPIQNAWAEHQSGQRNWQYLLWVVLMFQAWLDEQ